MFKSKSFAPALALAGVLGASQASADPLVIPAPDMSGAVYAPQQRQARFAPQRASSTQFTPGVQARPNYGGGFIEMLVTGSPGRPSRGALYNHPPEQPPAYVQPLPPQMAPAPYARQPARQTYASLPAEPIQRAVPQQFMRQEVDYRGPHGPGTIVVDTPNRFLYLVTAPGRATRYGIGVGRPGFEWAGVKSVTRKAEWPDWRPPSEMLKRRPDLPTFMAGGPDNPLGARALYLGSSLYRIHGTNEPHTIGQNVSSGCIRMMNEDVIDLYARVRVGAKVVVM